MTPEEVSAVVAHMDAQAAEAPEVVPTGAAAGETLAADVPAEAEGVVADAAAAVVPADEVPAAEAPTFETAKSFDDLKAVIVASGASEEQAIQDIRNLRGLQQALYTTPENFQAFLQDALQSPHARPIIDRVTAAREGEITKSWLSKNLATEAGRQKLLDAVENMRRSDGLPSDPDDPTAVALRRLTARQDALEQENAQLKAQLGGVSGELGQAKTTGEFEAFLRKVPEARKVQASLVADIQEARTMGVNFNTPGALAAFAQRRFEQKRRDAAALGAQRPVVASPSGKRPAQGGVVTTAKGAELMKDGKITKEALDAAEALLDGGAAN